MNRQDFARSGQQPADVYQAIFTVKSLRQRLARPAIELNSDRGPQAKKGPKGQTAGTGSQADGPGGGGPGGPPVQIDPSMLKANVAKFVKDAYGDSPEKALQVMKTIYGSDYHQLDLVGLEGRFQLITDLLTSLEGSDKGQALMEDVRDRIQTGMDQVPKAVLEAYR